MSDYDSFNYKKYTIKSEFDKAIHTLEGILKGISIDNKIDKYELSELSAWCKSNYNLIHRQPYKELIPFIEEALADNYLDKEEQEGILWYCKNFNSENIYYDVVTSDLQRLQGMLHGILANNEITVTELKNLNKWIFENEHLTGAYPYDELSSLICVVLKDGKIDDIEEQQLKIFFRDHILPAKKGSISEREISEYKKTMSITGVCSLDPEIIFKDKVFCFTGKSSRSKRSDIIDVITNYGGKYITGVSANTDYLIVGDNGNSCWAYSCYGRKVEQAVSLRRQGLKLIIAHENDFWDAVEDL
ncbi:MAG: hypothetical protein JXR63_01405 [Spirochaetales bacterium]|nr:hypothetical protein [Spirochaetales bacterium]